MSQQATIEPTPMEGVERTNVMEYFGPNILFFFYLFSFDFIFIFIFIFL